MNFEIYKRTKDLPLDELEWLWRLKGIKGKEIIAFSAKGFATEKECIANIHEVMLCDFTTPVMQTENKSLDRRYEDLMNDLLLMITKKTQ